MNQSTTQISLKYGLISGVIMASYSLLSYMKIIDSFDPTMKWLGMLFSLIVAVCIIYFCLNEIKNFQGGYLKFGKGVSSSLLVGVISGVISGLVSSFYLKFIDNSFLEASKDQVIAEYEKAGMTPQQIDTSLNYVEMMMHPGVLFVFGIISALIFSTIIGLIISSILQKEKSVFE